MIKATNTDRKRLRETCSQINQAVEPHFFSHLVIDVQMGSGLHTSIAHLHALAHRRTRAADYVQSLEIHCVSLCNGLTVHHQGLPRRDGTRTRDKHEIDASLIAIERELDECLPKAIASLEKCRSVT